jgi:hypothetical protein
MTQFATVMAQREAGLGHDRIVARLDVAIRDAHVAAGIRVDAVRKAVRDGDAVDVHIVRAQEADVVVRRIEQADALDVHELAALEGNRLRAVALDVV